VKLVELLVGQGGVAADHDQSVSCGRCRAVDVGGCQCGARLEPGAGPDERRSGTDDEASSARFGALHTEHQHLQVGGLHRVHNGDRAARCGGQPVFDASGGVRGAQLGQRDAADVVRVPAQPVCQEFLQVMLVVAECGVCGEFGVGGGS
jgi:hypothetical protein